MTAILGISAFYHDSAAAIIKDGNIIAAAQEERFSRIKHDSSYPFNSVEFVLKKAKLKLNDVDYIVFYEKPFLKFERLLETYVAFAPKGFKSFCMSIPLWLRDKLFQKRMIFNELKKHDERFDDINKIHFSEHHLSHAASAFYPSPFKDATILTLDGVGEWATTTVAIGSENNLEMIGLNYKDNIVNANNFLEQLKNPYRKILIDLDGTLAIEWGAYGVPESFLIKNGKIIKKVIGPLNEKSLLEIKDLIK